MTPLNNMDSRKSGEAVIKCRLQQGQSKGQLPAETQPADFARHLSSVMAGRGIQAANGATRAELRSVAAIALRCIEIGLSVLQAANSAARLVRSECAPQPSLTRYTRQPVFVYGNCR
jgi:hypothetical protein